MIADALDGSRQPATALTGRRYSILSPALRDETRHPGRHHRVEPAAGLNPADLVNGSFWNLREVVILTRPLKSFRRGQDSRSTLDSPTLASKHLPHRTKTGGGLAK
jgi:hypothetical protein